jgi:hypothetical protein
MVSAEVARGLWIDGINAAGQSPEQYLDFLISTRPHWEVPPDVIDVEDDTWLSGSLEKQGIRWNALRKFYPTDAATNKAMAEEAARYNAKFGSTKIGVKPGTAPAEGKGADDGKSRSRTNPWSDNFHDPQQRQAEMERLLKTIGTKACASLAKAAGKTVLGFPLTR